MYFTLLNTELNIAIKDILDKYYITEFSLFDIKGMNFKNIPLEVKNIDNKQIFFKIKCPLCGKVHRYSYSIKEFFKRQMIICGCECFGIPLFYIGNSKKVKERVTKHNELKEKMYMMM